MLECNGLWLSPRSDGRVFGLGPGGMRNVHDAATAGVIGRARYAQPSWLAKWWASEVLRVEEGTDFADLCSVRRSPWWDGGAWVLDADGQPVARWRGVVLELPRDGLRVA